MPGRWYEDGRNYFSSAPGKQLILGPLWDVSWTTVQPADTVLFAPLWFGIKTSDICEKCGQERSSWWRQAALLLHSTWRLSLVTYTIISHIHLRFLNDLFILEFSVAKNPWDLIQCPFRNRLSKTLKCVQAKQKQKWKHLSSEKNIWNS